jgi:hypothetical protein
MTISRPFKIGTAALVAATATAALALGTGGAASAATRATSAPRVAATCSTTARNYSFPKSAETFKAGAAGTVTVAPVNRGTIRVKSITRNAGWYGYVDSGWGSSVDVYFHNSTHHVKFEAEINDAGGLTVRVTTC